MIFHVTRTRSLSLILAALCLTNIQAEGEDFPTSCCLWYKQPALINNAELPWAGTGATYRNLPGKTNKDPWESQTLPVGNGRIGGTVFGGDCLDRVNLNEVSLWSGGPNLPGNGSGYAYGPKATQNQFGSYQPFGNLYVQLDLKGSTKDYTRSLDLREGIVRSSFSNGGTKYERECFVSEPDDVLVYHISSSGSEGVNAKIGITPYHDVSYAVEKDCIVMKGTLANGEEFEGRLMVRVNKGAKRSIRGKSTNITVDYNKKEIEMAPPIFSARGIPYFQIKDAESATVLVSMATDYAMDYKKNWKGTPPDVKNRKILARIAKKKVADIREDHLKHYKNLYNRLDIHLGKTDSDISALPTDERLAAYRRDSSPRDPELEATVYQYGRYVLISGSRPGNLPVNLQGIWNNKVHARWACDYHNNINLQMCYWGAEVANLSESHIPFIDFMAAMEEPLTEMTRKQFGSHVAGWTTRISQNPWGGGGWTMWNPPVNAWYALHLWDHYQFTQDKEYLRKVAWPLLKNIGRFWETHLKEIGAQGEGLLSGNKPLSVVKHPELKEIKAGSLVAPNGWSHEWGPTEDGIMHDQQLVDELFGIINEASDILGVDGAWSKKLKSMRKRLVPNRIGSGGYLQEWIVDRPDMVSGQRHTSHLIAVFPGSTITMEQTPALAKAARKSLELRGLSGDNRRSWTWPWRTALWARFKDARQAHYMVQNYLQHNCLDNLFGNHPPMQMDGTFGMTGGMSEILVQSHAGQIELLPALPDAWENGYVKGIKARGNITIDMTWKNGKVTKYKLTTTNPEQKPVTIVVNGDTKKVKPALAGGKKKTEKDDKPKKKKRRKRKA